MAKLNNKERDIVVDEIYNLVSEPIIKENNKLLEECSVPEDEYTIDYNTYNELYERIEELENKWKEKELNSFKFRYYGSAFSDYEKYISHRKEQLCNLKTYPSKQNIEKEIILSGNADIPTLIETITNKLKQ